MTGVRRGLAAVVLVMVAGLSACDDEAEPPRVDLPAAGDLFTCDRTFTRASEPPADLVEQGGISEWAGGYVGDGYVVRRAASSPLGLIALVSGDVARARTELVPRGVSVVAPWQDPQGDANPFAQVTEVVAQRLAPVAREVRREVRGLEGGYDVVPWVAGGAVVVQWRAPVPGVVQALAGERADRVRVILEEVPLSRHQVDRAAAAIEEADDLGVEVTATSGCAGGTGLVVGVPPDTEIDDRPALQERLAGVAGVPVLVVPLEAAAAPGP
ncbi:hypothetical protein [Nocardioides sp. W7]|uniref:hypothetical protein n=1 Tax=Nocardioides sp. W7 TaxID=2931390 RepID=UPI001FD0621B|nr:hypothetical protein [Nocardioides sp. W7]